MNHQLLSATDLQGLPLKNRIVMAPMTRSRAINNIPNDLMATYYAQRAGAGLIITEGTAPSPNGLGYARIPGVFSADQVEGWKKVTAAVHDKGAKIFLQIMHTGRVSHPLNMPEGSSVLAPSEIGMTQGQMYTDQEGMQAYPTPKAMDSAELKSTIQEYVTAAKNAIAAGFDGVEIHGANGYLVEQFIHPATNQRTDEYGGSIEHRIRFALEVCEAVAQAIGKEKTGIRLSPYGVFNELPIHDEIEETYDALSTSLNELGIAYIHLVDHSAMGAPKVTETVVSTIRNNFNNTLILSGGYNQERAERDLQVGKGDLVAFGRPFINNPDLVSRFEKAAPLNQDLDMDTFYTPGEKGYTDYPSLDN